MKNKFLHLSMIALTASSLFLASCSKEETKASTTTPEVFLASTTMGNRTAVLEDFTGVRCGYCPDGHVRAKAAQDLLGKDKFIIMAVHAGSYATPAAGWANFTTPFGTALVNQSNVAGYPAGTINRLLAADLGATPQQAGGRAMSRGDWATAAANVNAMFAPVNVGAKATFNAATRELTVKVDMYYSSNQTGVNNINVGLMQDKLMSKQSGATTNPYEQNHVLRHFITGQWGQTITEEKVEGAKISKTFTYTVPSHYNGTTADGGGAVEVDDLSVVVFITKDRTDILNAVEVDVQ